MCVFDSGVSLCDHLPIRKMFSIFLIGKVAQQTEGQRQAPGPGLQELEVFRMGSHLLGLRTDKTGHSCRGSPDQTWLPSCLEAPGPWRVGLPVEESHRASGHQRDAVTQGLVARYGTLVSHQPQKRVESSNTVPFFWCQVYVLDL